MPSTSDEDIAHLARLVGLAKSDPDNIRLLSPRDACAVALLLDRLDLLPEPQRHPLAALELLGPAGREMVLDLYHRRAGTDASQDA
ncbi:hypothetical protein [Inquilinus sp. CA228]|uniref:hypothetical protein n=1 Tax=Inquilinus sp. CA228 TaxID=3455609 RepID=UPI003F8D725E